MPETLAQQLNDQVVCINITREIFTGCFARPDDQVDQAIGKDMRSGGAFRLFTPDSKESSQPEAPASWKRCQLVKSRLQSTLERFSFPFLKRAIRLVPINRFLVCDTALSDLIAEGEEAAAEFARHDYAPALESAIAYYRDRADQIGMTPDEIEEHIRTKVPSPEPALIDGDLKYPVAKRFKFGKVAFECNPPGAVSKLDAELARSKQEEFGRDLERQAATVIEDIMQSVLAACSEQFTHLLENAEAGKWNQKSFNSIAKFIADARESLAVFNYSELTDSLQQFETECLSHTAKEAKTSEDLQQQLKDGLKGQIAHFQELADADKQAVIDRFGAQGKRRLQLD
jgi:hypothetical protein